MARCRLLSISCFAETNDRRGWLMGFPGCHRPAQVCSPNSAKCSRRRWWAIFRNQSGPRRLALALLLIALATGGAGEVIALDLTRTVIVSPPNLSRPEQKAITMLAEEVEKRTQLKWEATSSWPKAGTSVITVGQAPALSALDSRLAAELSKEGGVTSPEGFRIRTRSGATTPAVFVVGNDERGVLFGVGYLLRQLRMAKGSVALADDFRVTTAPRYALRGHQLGYRPKTHSYDAWDLAIWEQYYRDLVVFGVNAIELIPPRSDDAADSPHFPLPPMRMMVGMSKLADDYGLDVWIWFPAMDKDYSDPRTVEFALRE